VSPSMLREWAQALPLREQGVLLFETMAARLSEMRSVELGNLVS
jgi:hypothetical protein